MTVQHIIWNDNIRCLMSTFQGYVSEI